MGSHHVSIVESVRELYCRRWGGDGGSGGGGENRWAIVIEPANGPCAELAARCTGGNRHRDAIFI